MVTGWVRAEVSLRRTIFLALLAAVIGAAVLEGVLDVALEGLERRLAAGGGAVSLRLLLDLVDIPLFVLLGVVLASWLSRRIAAPLTRLTAATRDLEMGATAAELTVPPGEDELTQLVRGFNAMARAVDDHVERERAFTRYASHELRTPLAAIRLQAERARLGHAPAEAALTVVEKNVRQIEEVLEAMLALARSSDQAGERKPLSPLLEESLSALPLDCRSRVVVTGVFGGATVSHPRLVQQALTNLVDNALRHGGGRARIAVAVGDRHLTVRVSDDGPGVPPPSLPHLTEPFFQVEESREGLGLGLAFVAHVARALGGELTLSNAAAGLEATLRLPVAATSA